MEVETLSCGWIVKKEVNDHKVIDYNGKTKYLYVYTSPIDITTINQLYYKNILNTSIALDGKPCDNSYTLVLNSPLSKKPGGIDPITVLYKMSNALSVIHSRGIHHLNVGRDSIMFVNNEPMLTNFKYGKIFYEYINSPLPETNVNSLPPEYGTIIGGFTDVWMLGFYILNMFNIYEETEVTPYNYYVVKKLVDDFYEQDWSEAIKEYYISLPDIEEKATLIHRFQEKLGAKEAITKYYSSDPEDIEQLTDVVEDLEELENAIKELEGSKISTKVEFLNTLLHRMMDLDYNNRITSFDLEIELNNFLEITLSRGETYDISYGGNTVYDINRVRSFINKMYNLCLVNKYSFGIFAFALSYAFNLMESISNEDDLISSSLDIAASFCNNTPLSESLFRYLDKLSYYFYTSKMYTYARSDKHILALTEQLAAGSINYFTYNWEDVEKDERYELNKVSINSPVYNV